MRTLEILAVITSYSIHYTKLYDKGFDILLCGKHPQKPFSLFVIFFSEQVEDRLPKDLLGWISVDTFGRLVPADNLAGEA